jgi:hypothetical protein
VEPELCSIGFFNVIAGMFFGIAGPALKVKPKPN